MNTNTNNKPLLVCLTATRNYGWCTKAFLEANSQWADYIIVVDQMSTDNTRELCAQYENVIVVDNTDLTYSETIRCNLAINKAREIEGDKIFVYLAIDEVLSGNAITTKDWNKMLESNFSEVGLLKWANICSDGKHYMTSYKSNGEPFWMARIFHDDGISPYDNEGLDMHTHCIPYPKNATEFFLNDFCILHLEGYNTLWSADKKLYYQFVDYNKNQRSAIKLDRMYNSNRNTINTSEPMKNEWLSYGFDLFSYIDLSRQSFFFEQIKGFIATYGIQKYTKLNVWDDSLLAYLGISDPRSLFEKLIHRYLGFSRYKRNQFLFRAIDKILTFII